jgi:single-stranded-DNA-specific exonuclease
LGEKLAADLERLAPFGAGNPEPVLATYGLRAQARLLPSKEPGAEPHLKLQLASDAGPASAFDAIGFGMGGQAELCSGPVDAAFHLGVDEYQGRRRVQLRLKSLRPAEAGRS